MDQGKWEMAIPNIFKIIFMSSIILANILQKNLKLFSRENFGP